VQTDALPASHASVVICQMTSVIVDPSRFRITLEPAPGNGLRRRCQVMIDKPVTIRRTKIGNVVGRLTAEEMDRVNRALTFVLGLAD
jgi:mRNA interferase MazF